MGSIFIKNKFASWLLAMLRIVIGWHFLFEGMSKLVNTTWTAKAYLEGSRWIFGDLFRLMASGDTSMWIIDNANTFGLILIGLALILGLFTRFASWSGVALLALYYVAYPPFSDFSFGTPSEGNYLVVNKNLIELFALAFLAITGSGQFFGLDLLRKKKKKIAAQGGEEMTDKPDVPESNGRRELLKGLAGVPVLAIFSGAFIKHLSEPATDTISGATIKVDYKGLEDLSGKLPQGKLGNLNVTKMIMGCNLIGGWSHARDLIYADTLFKAYNNDKKIIETYYLAEQAGINTNFMVTRYYPVFNKYKKVYNSNMQSICQAILPEKDFFSDIKVAVDSGATAVYIQGNVGDSFCMNGKFDELFKAIDHIKKQGLMAGMGAHSIETIKACEREGLPADFYVKTLHHDKYWSAHPEANREEYSVIGPYSDDHNKNHDNIWDLFPSKTIEYMKGVNKPWIAFKVLAAGAITPKDGFRYAFENGADFICVGMFDFQVIENVNTASEILKGIGSRERGWYS
jgi:uncharacterized membrane protein YphA (DoxX/SURF4 family)